MRVRELIKQLSECELEAEIEMRLVDGFVPIVDVVPSEYVGMVYLECND